MVMAGLIPQIIQRQTQEAKDLVLWPQQIIASFMAHYPFANMYTLLVAESQMKHEEEMNTG